MPFFSLFIHFTRNLIGADKDEVLFLFWFRCHSPRKLLFLSATFSCVCFGFSAFKFCSLPMSIMIFMNEAKNMHKLWIRISIELETFRIYFTIHSALTFMRVHKFYRSLWNFNNFHFGGKHNSMQVVYGEKCGCFVYAVKIFQFPYTIFPPYQFRSSYEIHALICFFAYQRILPRCRDESRHDLEKSQTQIVFQITRWWWKSHIHIYTHGPMRRQHFY